MHMINVSTVFHVHSLIVIVMLEATSTGIADIHSQVIGKFFYYKMTTYDNKFNLFHCIDHYPMNPFRFCVAFWDGGYIWTLIFKGRGYQITEESLNAVYRSEDRIIYKSIAFQF